MIIYSNQDTGSTGKAILDFINRGGLINAMAGMGYSTSWLK
jgi:hypothetical protein